MLIPSASSIAVSQEGITDPFTMTVTRNDAYVLWSNGVLTRSGLDGTACKKVFDFETIVGISTPPESSPSSLIVYHLHPPPVSTQSSTAWIGRLYLEKAELVDVAQVAPDPRAGYPIDLKTDTSGRTFAFDAGGTLFQVDSKTGAVVERLETKIANEGGDTLLTYNDEIYAITGRTGLVDKYDRTTRTTTRVAEIGETINGAGAMRCEH
jgi:hypothetical protein